MSRASLRPQGLQNRISHLIQHWPKDAVRPASVSVQNYLQSCLRQPTTSETSRREATKKQEQGTFSVSESSVKVLEGLLDNHYSKKYPFPKSLRYPASDPDHYDKVLREFEEAPNRSWFGRLRKRLSGAIRFQ